MIRFKSHCFLKMKMMGKTLSWKSVVLSVIPSALFLARGVLTMSVPLMALGAVFAVCHVTISVQNALLSQKADQQ